MPTLAFDVLLACHVVSGAVCAATGALASVTTKRRSWHPRWGTVYYWSFGAVFASATGLALMRWSADWYLVVIGTLALGCATLGYAARKIAWKGWSSAHIVGMGVSYIGLLTAFYVDNGPHLPLWQLLPPIAFWLLPGLIGVPLVIRALVRRRSCAHARRIW